MSHEIRIHETGGPEQLRWEEVDPGRPASGQVLLRQEAIGLNYIDTYHRTGLYPAGDFPATLGREAAGVIEEVGTDVAGFEVGDRAAYVLVPGAYAERRVIDAASLIPIPDGITAIQAAGMLLKGLTAQFLLRRTFEVQPGQTILFHAAAGGVGTIACQWAHSLGATVIGTVGSQEKAEMARSHGCDHPILYREVDFVEETMKITGGKKLPVVYDSVGHDTFAQSLRCLQPRGLMVLFGQASGPVEPFSPGILATHGSLYLTRPTLANYIADRDERLEAARQLFDAVLSGAIRIEVGQTYPLREAEQAHRDLEARKTSGSTVFKVDRD